MNNLISIKNENGKKLVSAKELYLGLGLSKTQWSRWYPTNITNNDYFKENVDWVGVRHYVEGAETMDFAISIDFAKHIAMMARTEKSHEYRNYFIAMETEFKEDKSRLLENANNSMADISPLLNEANCTPSQKLIVFKGILRRIGIELPLEILEPFNSRGASFNTKIKSHVSDFLLEKCEMQEGRTTIQELYGTYIKWCKENCVNEFTLIAFGKCVRSSGITNGRSNGGRYWRNLIIKN